MNPINEHILLPGTALVGIFIEPEKYASQAFMKEEDRIAVVAALTAVDLHQCSRLRENIEEELRGPLTDELRQKTREVLQILGDEVELADITIEHRRKSLYFLLMKSILDKVAELMRATSPIDRWLIRLITAMLDNHPNRADLFNNKIREQMDDVGGSVVPIVEKFLKEHETDIDNMSPELIDSLVHEIQEELNNLNPGEGRKQAVDNIVNSALQNVRDVLKTIPEGDKK